MALAARGEFRLLGPMELRVGEDTVELGAPKQRAMLALLLLNAGEVVSLDTLTKEIWGTRPPQSAWANLRTYAAGLRRAMVDVTSSLVARPTGYRLDLHDTMLDVTNFTRLTYLGRAALAAGDAAGAVASLHQALALWRGRPGEDISVGDVLAAAFEGLERERLTALEDSFEARLALAEGSSLVAPIRRLLADHPLRERAWGQLMRASYQAGDVANAVRAFAEARAVLAEELGLEPGPQLQELHRRILSRDPTLVPIHNAAAAHLPQVVQTAVVPRELPPTTTHLVGREAEMALVVSTLIADQTPASSPAIVAIHGLGGVGKSALAVAAGHAVAAHFPDGQLYVDLQGASPGLRPLAVGEVLGRLLRALGVPAARVPSAAPEAAALYRTLTSQRRLLVVADNAANLEQVLPVLPATNRCAVIVTSRRIFGVLDGAMVIHLNPLAPLDAETMLGLVVGPGRAIADPRGVAEVAASCGYLPLALRLAGARLVGRKDWAFSDLARRLVDERQIIAELTSQDLNLRASLSVSWQELDDHDPVDALAKQVFLAMGALSLPDFHARLVADLVEAATGLAETAVDRLVQVRLVDAVDGHYGMHDVLRSFAMELAAGQSAGARHEILRRALQWYASGAASVGQLMHGRRRPGPEHGSFAIEFDSPVAAGGWLDRERANLVGLVRQSMAAPAPLDRMGAQLVVALYPSLLMRSHAHEWEALCRAVIDSADRLNQPGLVAEALTKLAVLYRFQSRLDEALDCLERGLAIQKLIGDRAGEASTLETAGMVHVRGGDPQRAAQFFEDALALRRELDNPVAEGITLSNAAEAFSLLNDHDRALAMLNRSLEIRRRSGDLAGEAITLMNIGEVRLKRGELDAARASADSAVRRSRQAGVRERQAISLRARVLLRMGLVTEALSDCESIIGLAESGSAADSTDLEEIVTALNEAGQHGHADEIRRRMGVTGAI